MDADPRSRQIEELEGENARLRAENESLKAEVQSLRQLVKQFKAEVQSLRQLIKQLQERTEELERSAARQAAPFRRKDKDRKAPDEHGKPGRKPGHPPAYRKEPPQIDDHVEVVLTQCPCCGGQVTDVETCEQFIEDLPPTRPHVTRLVTYCSVSRCLHLI